MTINQVNVNELEFKPSHGRHYKINITIRAGENLHCNPREYLSDFTKYKTFEVMFFRRHKVLNSQYWETWESVSATQATSCRDLDRRYSCDKDMHGTLFYGNVSEADFKHIHEKLIEHHKTINAGQPEPIVVKDYIQLHCRSCLELNPFAESDNLTNAAQYTCWSCGTHPERYMVGLTTQDQFDAVKALYKKKVG